MTVEALDHLPPSHLPSFQMETRAADSPTPEKFAQLINDAIKKTGRSLLETATICAEADRTLSAAEKRQMMKNLNFSKATFSKFVAVGKHERLSDDRCIEHIPADRLAPLYELSHYSSDKFDAAVEEGIIHPKVTTAVIRRNNPGATVRCQGNTEVDRALDPLAAIRGTARREKLDRLIATYRARAQTSPLGPLVNGEAQGDIARDYAIIPMPKSGADKDFGDFVLALNSLSERFHIEPRIETLPRVGGSLNEFLTNE